MFVEITILDLLETKFQNSKFQIPNSKFHPQHVGDQIPIYKSQGKPCLYIQSKPLLRQRQGMPCLYSDLPCKQVEPITKISRIPT